MKWIGKLYFPKTSHLLWFSKVDFFLIYSAVNWQKNGGRPGNKKFIVHFKTEANTATETHDHRIFWVGRGYQHLAPDPLNEEQLCLIAVKPDTYQRRSTKRLFFRFIN